MTTFNYMNVSELITKVSLIFLCLTVHFSKKTLVKPFLDIGCESLSILSQKWGLMTTLHK